MTKDKVKEIVRQALAIERRRFANQFISALAHHCECDDDQFVSVAKLKEIMKELRFQ